MEGPGEAGRRAGEGGRREEGPGEAGRREEEGAGLPPVVPARVGTCPVDEERHLACAGGLAARAPGGKGTWAAAGEGAMVKK